MYDFNFWTTLITIVVVMGVLQLTCAYLIYVERKVAAYVQDRIGPNRVGPFGLLQPIADGLKFLLKEDVIPGHVDKLLFLLAPAIAVSTATLAFAVVPFGPTDTQPRFIIAPGIDIGIVFIFAVSSLAVYAIILGGWSANNKYSFLGALRSSAQLVSYEIPLGMSILGVVLLTGSLNLERMIDHQVAYGWNILYQPLAFLLFLTSAFAETNRLPFDLPEAEQELVGGYHTEYSALKFGMFFLGEYTHVITTSFLMSILFFGGWHFPGAGLLGNGALGVAVKVIVLALKVTLFVLFYMLVRWTVPRFRFDQLMGLTWKVLIPLALLNVVAVMVVLQLRWSPWVLLAVSLALVVGAGFVTLSWPRGPRRVMVITRGREGLETVVPS
jgi:NADH-quinone oxidoreductase subunit H